MAHIAEKYDRGYGHFTTRQNIQYNWVTLEDTPDILAELAKVEMHAIQTSGNCIRNVTADQFSGVAHDEIEDPRPTAELLRQWSSLHPEFTFLPRKFKIAITGAKEDRAAIGWHDVGLQLLRNPQGDLGFRVQAGGGMGRTPIIGSVLREFLPAHDILNYLEALVRVYNLWGRRDNLYKARIKILVKAEGARFADEVDAEFRRTLDSGAAHRVTEAELREGQLRVRRRRVAERIEMGLEVSKGAVRVDELMDPRLLQAVDDRCRGVRLRRVARGLGEGGGR